jgi:hypothetical protein
LSGKPCWLLPKDSGMKVALARGIVTQFFQNRKALLYVPLYDVWDSSEMPFVFEGYRSVTSELASVGEKPGTLFEAHEGEQLTGLLGLAILFMWDFVIIADVPHVEFTFSHDEFFCVKGTTLEAHTLGLEFADAWDFERCRDYRGKSSPYPEKR